MANRWRWRVQACWIIAVALAGPPGCSFAGAFKAAGAPVKEPGTPHGGALRVDSSVHLARDSGLVLGVESELGAESYRTYSGLEDRWRVGPRFGYASLPLPYRYFLGGEGTLHAGFARLPTAADTEFSGYYGISGALVARLTEQQTMARSERILWPTAMLFVEPELTWFHPLGAGADHGVRFEVAAAIGVRTYLWSSVIP